MTGQRTISSLGVCALMVTGCGVSAQSVANKANATRFYDSRLMAPGAVVASDDPEESAPVVELRLATRFALAPAAVHSMVRVPAHPDNRRLRVLIDGAQYYRSSDTQLDGVDAAKHYFFTWQELPPGSYSVIAIVYGERGVRGQRAGTLEVVGDRNRIFRD
jgi:hypothetical protein